MWTSRIAPRAAALHQLGNTSEKLVKYQVAPEKYTLATGEHGARHPGGVADTATGILITSPAVMPWRTST